MTADVGSSTAESVAPRSSGEKAPEALLEAKPPRSSRGRLDIGVFGIRGIPSTYSGYETFLTVILPEMVRRGHAVTVYCRSAEDEDWRGDYAGVKRVSLPSIKTKQLDTLSHGLVSSIVSRLRRHDCLLVCNVGNAPFCAISRATGQRVVLNTDGQEWIRGKWGRLAKFVFLSSAKIAKYSASGLVSDCNAMKDIYRREFRAESSTIPYCWTDLSAASESGVPDFAGDYFVTGGRLVPENNIDRIAETYCQTSINLPLLVLGTANYESPVQMTLDRLAASDSRIHLRGHISDRAEYSQLLSGARAYLHGHSVGGMNPSLVEAMGSGAMIAALGTSFNREVLGPDGCYFDLDSEQLMAVFEMLAGLTREDSTQRRRKNIDRAATRFSLSAVADAYLELLHAAADASPFSTVTIPTQWDEA